MSTTIRIQFNHILRPSIDTGLLPDDLERIDRFFDDFDRREREQQFGFCKLAYDDAVSTLIQNRIFPVVYSYECQQMRPDARAIEIVRSALHKLPECFLRAIVDGGKKIEVCSGNDARVHYSVASLEKSRLWGAANRRGMVVAAGSKQLGATALHEAAHVLDILRELEISNSPTWQKIWRQALSAGRVPALSRQQELAAEYFAEQFTAFYWSSETRSELQPDVRNFMSTLPKLFLALTPS